MVIDDEVDMGTILSHMIRRAGHEVKTFTNPSVAVHEVSEFHPQVIICDMHMPGTTGIDLLKSLWPSYRGTFIFLTGDITTNIEEISTFGVKHVLFKPQDLARVIPILNEISLTQS